VQEVGRELGVRFILEGSVRKVGNHVRITAQLVDAITGGHLWAERYDRELTDIFKLQDEVTREIVAALSLNLTKGEEGRLARRDTDNLTAYDHVLRGMEHHWRYTKEANAQAQMLFQKAIELDPGYALAYSWLGMTVLHSWTQGWNQDHRALAAAFELAQKAIALDDSLAEAHRILGDVYLYRKQHEEAISELKTAIALNPNYADAFAGLGDVLNWAGRAQEAIDFVKTAIRLNPHHHAWYFYTLGLSYLSLYRTDEAIEVLRRGLIRNPDFLAIRLALAGLYAEIGDREKARIEVEEVLRISPYFSLKVFQEMVPTKNVEIIERMMDLLRKAGLPD
jgi:tetratricopeptide (TPR) repeat protein